MAETWFNDSGTWRQATEIWFNDGGTWREATEVWANDGGTWRQVFGGGSPTVTLAGIYDSVALDLFPPLAARADIGVETDGDIGKYQNNAGTTQGTYSDIGDWVDDKTGLTSSDFQYNCYKTAGVTPSGSSLHANGTTFSTLSANLNWYLTGTGSNRDCGLFLTIREIADTGNTDAAILNITVEF